MKKEAFLELLEQRLRGLPEDEIQKILSFYQESIQDRMEDGADEDAAVAQLGDPEKIIREVQLEMPLGRLVKNKVQQNREKSGRSAIWIILTILGIPFWVPLLLAAVLIILSGYLVIWMLLGTAILMLLALGFSFAVLSAGAAVCLFTVSPPVGFFLTGAALLCIGILLLGIRPVCFLSQQIGMLSVRFGRWIKSLLISGKGAV